MKIVASFDNYEEMEAFAENIMKDRSQKEDNGSSCEPEMKQPEHPDVPKVPTAAVQPAASAQPMAPVQPAAPVPTTGPAQQEERNMDPTVVPTNSQTYTLDELARAAMTLMDAGRQVDLQGLVRNFGVVALPALPKDRYGAFATALREMGAQI